MAFLPPALLYQCQCYCVENPERERESRNITAAGSDYYTVLPVALPADCLCEEEPGQCAIVNRGDEVWKGVQQ